MAVCGHHKASVVQQTISAYREERDPNPKWCLVGDEKNNRNEHDVNKVVDCFGSQRAETDVFFSDDQLQVQRNRDEDKSEQRCGGSTYHRIKGLPMFNGLGEAIHKWIPSGQLTIAVVSSSRPLSDE